jgi:hypothetical protein
MEIEQSTTSSRLLRVSTEMFAERERFSAFREEFARRVLMMDVIDHSGGRPRIEVTFMPLGPAAVGTLAATPAEFLRHKHHLKSRSDGFVLQIIGTGPIHFTHVGGERTCDAGGAHFVHQERPLRGFGRRHVSIQSFTEHLVKRRLDRAFALLSDRRYLHLAIVDIAFAAGFGDVSHFNRVFRRRFGDTPSGVRAAAITPEQP